MNSIAKTQLYLDTAPEDPQHWEPRHLAPDGTRRGWYYRTHDAPPLRFEVFQRLRTRTAAILAAETNEGQFAEGPPFPKT